MIGYNANSQPGQEESYQKERNDLRITEAPFKSDLYLVAESVSVLVRLLLDSSTICFAVRDGRLGNDLLKEDIAR